MALFGAVGVVVMATTPAVTAVGAVAVAGVMAVNIGGPASGSRHNVWLGSLLVFGAVCCEAAYTLLGKAVVWWGAGTMGLGSVSWFRGLMRVAGTTASGFMAVIPLNALLLSYLLLGGSFAWIHAVGMAAVVTGSPPSPTATPGTLSASADPPLRIRPAGKVEGKAVAALAMRDASANCHPSAVVLNGDRHKRRPGWMVSEPYGGVAPPDLDGDVMTLVITTHRVPEPTMTIAVAPQGGIRSDNAHMLRDRFIAVLAATRPQRIVVDLSAVSSIDEAGIDALRAGRDAAFERGASLVVADPDPRVRDALRGQGLSRVLEVA